MAKDPSVFAATIHTMEAADEHRRTVARPPRGRAPGTRNAIEGCTSGRWPIPTAASSGMSRHPSARIRGEPDAARVATSRFGGRTAETHSLRDGTGRCGPTLHLPAAAPRVRLPRGGHGLVLSLRALLASGQHPGRGLLPGSARRGAVPGASRDFQHRPGSGNSPAGNSRGGSRRPGCAWSRDGRGRCWDNIFIERLWRSLKYEDIYLKGYETVAEIRDGVDRYFDFYNQDRFHQALGYATPVQVYRAA